MTPFPHRRFVLLCLLAPWGPPLDAQQGPASLNGEARTYLSTALDTLQAIVLGRDTLSWSVVRDSAFLLADGAEEIRDTYGALDWALRRANRHSFLQAPRPGALSRSLREGAVGYVRVPERGGVATALADSLHDAVRALADAGACGWIVDLRGNGGGNMWPMLAGIGPLLGDSLVGSFGAKGEQDRWFYRAGLSGLLHEEGRLDTLSRVTVPPVPMFSPEAPVAVLIDEGTGSSGEAVAVAFRGRPQTRFFGTGSAGYATSNRGSRLPDGANMVVTTGYYRDRRGVQQGDRIGPDVEVPGGVSGWPFPTDRVARVAAEWLATRLPCR